MINAGLQQLIIIEKAKNRQRRTNPKSKSKAQAASRPPHIYHTKVNVAVSPI
jgi:hypothetical protein